MGGDRPVSRWVLTPWKSVLLHRRRERVSGSDVLGWGGGATLEWEAVGGGRKVGVTVARVPMWWSVCLNYGK